MLLNKIPLSFSHMFLLFLYHLANWYQVLSASYRIQFDAQFSPPTVIPKNPKDLVYSVPLNQLINQPIIVRVMDASSFIITPEGNPDVIVSSLDVSNLKGGGSDSWTTTGGKFCQRTLIDQTWPKRLDRGRYKKICGSKQGLTVLIKKFVNDKVILDWLSHEHPKGIVPNSRFLRVSIPDMKLTADTNFFNITVPAAALIISKQPPTTITANTGFDISAEIRDIHNNLITEGLDSVLYVEVTVPYEYKQFHNHMGKDMLIYNTDVRLGGDNVATHQSTNDLVIRKQASAGRVHFTDVRVLDIITQCRLNLTMYMSRDPWLRSPNCITCYADIYEKDVIYDLVRFRPMTKNFLKKTPAVILTTVFKVVKQTLNKLFLKSPFNTKHKIKITRNFPIPGPMYLEARDKYGHRIYSGPHSTLPIEIETNPKDVCISVDKTRYIRGGYGKLEGSICQIVASVHLIIYSKVDHLVIVNSTNFEVVGDVHIGHFDHFTYSGAGWDLAPHINSFVRFGADDINTGAIPGVLKHFQMKIIVDTVETRNNVEDTMTLYGDIRLKAETEPSTELRAVLMPVDPRTSSALIRIVNNNKIVMLSLSQKRMEFEGVYYFNRMCWNWDQITRFFMVACKERMWTHLSILQMSDEEMPASFLSFSAEVNITINEEVSIPLFDPKQWKKGMLSDHMKDLQDYKTRIIICLVNATYQPIVLSEAYLFGLSSLKGYQWVFLSDYAWAFPIKSLCGENMKCSEAFKGSLLFTETYNNSNFHSADWYRALNNFMAADRVNIMGLEVLYPESDTGSAMALGYDAVWLFSEALSRIISRQYTATGLRINQELRKFAIEGLTGELKLSNSGDRTGFFGTIKVINSEPDSRIQLIRLVKSVSPGDQVEFNYANTPKYFDSASNLTMKMITLPHSAVYNVRDFFSYSGGISEANNMLEEDKSEAWPSIRIHRFEKVVPQFTCNSSCGKRVSIHDINLYDRGICIALDTCDCSIGYYGDNCGEITCDCMFGSCFVPFKCVCYEGWAGEKCDTPICRHPCVNGKCEEPEKCKCSSSAWIGERCNEHIAMIIVPLIVIVGALVCFVYRGSFLLRKYLERRAALCDLSWVVTWTDISKVDTAGTSKASCAIEELLSWNHEKWYAKYFNSKTIDVDDTRVRYDMVELVTMHHKNLITYGGACLTYPHVCLLLEPTYKGSLEDILVNESIQLGWDFRFSFMKDICNGVHFLHTKTDLHSHGRLKSSNCLLDNRWTIRLSGFGANSIRYGPYSIQQIDPEATEVYYENQTALLWTAPELLQSASCLDDVRKGTQEGDSYSFGIIVSEIATRCVPFEHELNFLSLFSILDLIVDKDNPDLESEREMWSSIGGDLFLIRPQITSDQLPESKAVKNKFKKMLNELWCEEPQLRLAFNKLIPLLDKIYPSKGELMDNLIHLLESYSSNLEKVVNERTKDLEVEKVKIDNIVSQMLPRRVVESLKNGEKVQPEIFDNVTVFYSDIVGFTTIAKKSKPMQVVDLLNTLYGKFDSVLARYDVYKVETIGDAYVVSSGVPELNGNLHAGEIATASIDIVCTIMTVPIPHLPEDKLLLRIGIHSGSVVGGVVGLKMPRYTLFGETMQITGNMESTSKPLHIQVSHCTIDILDELGGYIYKRRGEKEVCGRKLTTYWLVGKEGYDMVLPEIED